MIVFIAPYASGNSTASSLGGARKIETLLKVLSSLDRDIVLVNSAHAEKGPAGLRVLKGEVSGVPLTEIRLPLFFQRTMGKLINLAQSKLVEKAIAALGKPDLIWIYNGYAFESILARNLKKRWHCPLVLEFEDWHFSRGRGLNPKPFLDYLAWRRVLPMVDQVFAVNEPLGRLAAGRPVHLLPGVVPSVLNEIRRTRTPFESNAIQATVGYFGGLTAEKGADVVLELARLRLPSLQIIASGAGALSKQFEAEAAINPSLSFGGVVSDERLGQLIASCDVIVNPHSPIAHMQNGVFPFKVIEAVASGRLLISTPLPVGGLSDVLDGVLFFDGSMKGLLAALASAREFYAANAAVIARAASAAERRFGEQGILDVLRHMRSTQS